MRFTAAEIEAGRKLFAADWQFAAAAGTSEAPAADEGRRDRVRGPLQCRQVEPDQRAHRAQGAGAHLEHAGPHAGADLLRGRRDSPLRLVDMPGYGYAEAPKARSQAWTALIHAYLSGRANLVRVYVLIDARHGLKDADAGGAQDARRGGGELSDRADQGRPAEEGELEERMADDAAALAKRPAAFPEIPVTSSREGEGMPELRAAIVRLVKERG